MLVVITSSALSFVLGYWLAYSPQELQSADYVNHVGAKEILTAPQTARLQKGVETYLAPVVGTESQKQMLIEPIGKHQETVPVSELEQLIALQQQIYSHHQTLQERLSQALNGLSVLDINDMNRLLNLADKFGVQLRREHTHQLLSSIFENVGASEADKLAAISYVKQPLDEQDFLLVKKMLADSSIGQPIFALSALNILAQSSYSGQEDKFWQKIDYEFGLSADLVDVVRDLRNKYPVG